MKRLKKSMIILMAAIFVFTLSISAALAGSFEKPETDPPHGLAVQENAPGLKLVGPMSVEYNNFVSTYELVTLENEEESYCNNEVLLSEEGDARVTVRLQRNDNDIHSYYTEANAIDMLADPSVDQGIITEKLRCRILKDFFGIQGYLGCLNSSIEIKLKSVKNFANMDAKTSFTGDPAACTPSIEELDPDDGCRQYCEGSKFYILDVELAVK